MLDPAPATVLVAVSIVVIVLSTVSCSILFDRLRLSRILESQHRQKHCQHEDNDAKLEHPRDDQQYLARLVERLCANYLHAREATKEDKLPVNVYSTTIVRGAEAWNNNKKLVESEQKEAHDILGYTIEGDTQQDVQPTATWLSHEPSYSPQSPEAWDRFVPVYPMADLIPIQRNAQSRGRATGFHQHAGTSRDATGSVDGSHEREQWHREDEGMPYYDEDDPATWIYYAASTEEDAVNDKEDKRNHFFGRSNGSAEAVGHRRNRKNKATKGEEVVEMSNDDGAEGLRPVEDNAYEPCPAAGLDGPMIGENDKLWYHVSEDPIDEVQIIEDIEQEEGDSSDETRSSEDGHEMPKADEHVMSSEESQSGQQQNQTPEEEPSASSTSSGSSSNSENQYPPSLRLNGAPSFYLYETPMDHSQPRRRYSIANSMSNDLILYHAEERYGGNGPDDLHVNRIRIPKRLIRGIPPGSNLAIMADEGLTLLNFIRGTLNPPLPPFDGPVTGHSLPTPRLWSEPAHHPPGLSTRTLPCPPMYLQSTAPWSSVETQHIADATYRSDSRRTVQEQRGTHLRRYLANRVMEDALANPEWYAIDHTSEAYDRRVSKIINHSLDAILTRQTVEAAQKSFRTPRPLYLPTHNLQTQWGSLLFPMQSARQQERVWRTQAPTTGAVPRYSAATIPAYPGMSRFGQPVTSCTPPGSSVRQRFIGRTNSETFDSRNSAVISIRRGPADPRFQSIFVPKTLKILLVSENDIPEDYRLISKRITLNYRFRPHQAINFEVDGWWNEVENEETGMMEWRLCVFVEEVERAFWACEEERKKNMWA